MDLRFIVLPDQNQQALAPLKWSVVLGADDRLNKWAARLWGRVFSPNGLAARFSQKVCVFVQEWRSLRGRTSLRFAGMTWIPIYRAKRVETDPIERDFLSRVDLRRSQDTQQMLANHPWASLVDCRLFVEGWNKGAQCVSQDCKLGWDIRV
jgi:hypothetical protein